MKTFTYGNVFIGLMVVYAISIAWTGISIMAHDGGVRGFGISLASILYVVTAWTLWKRNRVGFYFAYVVLAIWFVDGIMFVASGALSEKVVAGVIYLIVAPLYAWYFLKKRSLFN